MSVEDFRLANLTPEQMKIIEDIENRLGLTLIAYETEPEIQEKLDYLYNQYK